MKRTPFKTLIKKHGIKKILKNPQRYLIKKSSEYNSQYLNRLKSKLTKHYERKSKEKHSYGIRIAISQQSTVRTGKRITCKK